MNTSRLIHIALFFYAAACRAAESDPLARPVGTSSTALQAVGSNPFPRGLPPLRAFFSCTPPPPPRGRAATGRKRGPSARSVERKRSEKENGRKHKRSRSETRRPPSLQKEGRGALIDLLSKRSDELIAQHPRLRKWTADYKAQVIGYQALLSRYKGLIGLQDRVGSLCMGMLEFREEIARDHHASLASCEDRLGHCHGALRACENRLGHCQDALRICGGGLGKCEAALRNSENRLVECEAALRDCENRQANYENELVNYRVRVIALQSAVTGLGQQHIQLGKRVDVMEKEERARQGRLGWLVLVLAGCIGIICVSEVAMRIIASFRARRNSKVAAGQGASEE